MGAGLLLFGDALNNRVGRGLGPAVVGEHHNVSVYHSLEYAFFLIFTSSNLLRFGGRQSEAGMPHALRDFASIWFYPNKS